MSTPESAQPNLIEVFVQRHMDEHFAEQQVPVDMPKDMQQFLRTIIGAVLVMSDHAAEAASVAYDPDLTYEHYRNETPDIFKHDPDLWKRFARSELRMCLSAMRFEHDLPMFLPHHAEGDYDESELFCSAVLIAGRVTARCFFGLEPYIESDQK